MFYKNLARIIYVRALARLGGCLVFLYPPIMCAEDKNVCFKLVHPENIEFKSIS